jgi:hypothetical protein
MLYSVISGFRREVVLELRTSGLTSCVTNQKSAVLTLYCGLIPICLHNTTARQFQVKYFKSNFKKKKCEVYVRHIGHTTHKYKLNIVVFDVYIYLTF